MKQLIIVSKFIESQTTPRSVGCGGSLWPMEALHLRWRQVPWSHAMEEVMPWLCASSCCFYTLCTTTQMVSQSKNPTPGRLCTTTFRCIVDTSLTCEWCCLLNWLDNFFSSLAGKYSASNKPVLTCFNILCFKQTWLDMLDDLNNAAMVAESHHIPPTSNH